MADITMKALLESGVHFGHRTRKWNPHMKPYIFTERNGIHILDLQQTVKALSKVYNIVRDISAEGGVVLFVGTKRQAQDTIILEAERCGMPHVTVRWLGGMLTNWRTMRERIQELERLERMRDRGDFERVTKREALSLTRMIEKLEGRFGGIRHMVSLPDLLFVVDVSREDTAVKEANILDIPVLAMVDTNCDPRNIDYVVPSNDDAIRAIKLIVGHIADAIIEGHEMRKEEDDEDLPPTSVEFEAEQIVEQMSDEELLGEATLAKMTAQAEAEARDEAVAGSEEDVEGDASGAMGDEVEEVLVEVPTEDGEEVGNPEEGEVVDDPSSDIKEGDDA
jgi:small subunit ribosomal protein S2